ncbi:MAG: family 43 glycosylhydrolase [Planctomycetota bacterium]
MLKSPHAASPLTYCNPLPLPDYPRGRCSIDPSIMPGGDVLGGDFRETADPTVLYEADGPNGARWVLYSSAGMAYVSEDFVTWRHHRVEPYDAGYAPTVEKFRGRYLLTACTAGLWVSDDALGPFVEVGPFVDPDGEPVPEWMDPMLFADGDALFAYWGLGEGGIKGAPLDPDEPRKLLEHPKTLFEFDASKKWERYGEHNEDASKSFTEGAWMLKANGKYFLTFAGPGTEFSTYAMGAYVGETPMGPFVYQRRTPICADRHGLVRGPGHGCIVPGPGGTWWAFYTCAVCVRHMFERRIGMDPAGFDADGHLFVDAASEAPRRAPGRQPQPHSGNSPEWLPVNHAKQRVTASSVAAGRDWIYATDGSMKTWWQPTAGDVLPSLEIELGRTYTLRSCRVVWTEPQLDYEAGLGPEATGWRLEARVGGDWKTVVDRWDSTEDWLIDYRACEAVEADAVRLSWDRARRATAVGVVDWSVFGEG